MSQFLTPESEREFNKIQDSGRSLWTICDETDDCSTETTHGSRDRGGSGGRTRATQNVKEATMGGHSTQKWPAQDQTPACLPGRDEKADSSFMLSLSHQLPTGSGDFNSIA